MTSKRYKDGDRLHASVFNDLLDTVEQLERETERIRKSIPTKTSQLVNNSGFITEETDPTVPAWAKKPNKPTYTAAEVGALPDTTVIPTATSQLTNDSGFLTEHQPLKTINDETLVGTGNIVIETTMPDVTVQETVDELNCTTLYLNDNTFVKISGTTLTSSQTAEYISSVVAVEIGDGVRNIGDNVFNGASGCTKIYIGCQVVSIGDNAFYDCFNVSNVFIPSDVMYIGTDAFYRVFHITYLGPATGAPWGALTMN